MAIDGFRLRVVFEFECERDELAELLIGFLRGRLWD
jgi:hypothetical protein